MEPNSPAERAGIKRGDILLAADEFRMFEAREFPVERCRYPQTKPIRFVINRDGKLLAITLKTVMSGRLAGLYSTRTFPLDALVRELNAAGMSCDAKTTELLKSYPGRAFAAYLEWRETAGRDAPAQWFKENVEMFLALMQQEYRDFGAGSPSPVPFVENLSKFYRAISTRHRSGPHTPDWNAYGDALSRTFWAIYFPCPPYRIPELGSLHLTDSAFQVALATSREKYDAPTGDLQFTATQYTSLSSADPAENYISVTKASLIDPDNHDGWPYRFDMVCENAASRASIVASLREKAGRNDPDRVLYNYTMVAPLLIDGKPAEAVALIEEVRKTSPYLAFCAVQNALKASVYCWGDKNNTGLRTLRDYILAQSGFENPPVPFHLFLLKNDDMLPVANGRAIRFANPEKIFRLSVSAMSGTVQPSGQMAARQDAWQNLEAQADALYAKHQNKEAYQIYRQVDASAPPSAIRQWLMGRCQHKIGNLEASSAHFETALALFGDKEDTAFARMRFMGNLLSSYQEQGKLALYRQRIDNMQRAVDQVVAIEKKRAQELHKPEELLSQPLQIGLNACVRERAELLEQDAEWAKALALRENLIDKLKRQIPLNERTSEGMQPSEETALSDLVKESLDAVYMELAAQYTAMDEPQKALEISRERALLPAQERYFVEKIRANADMLLDDITVNGPDRESFKKIDALLKLAEESREVLSVLSSLLVKAKLLALSGSRTEARTIYDPLLKRLRETSDNSLFADAMHASAENHMALGQNAEAEAEIRASVDLFRKLGKKAKEPLLLIAYARAIAAQGRTDEAMKTLREGLRLCATLKLPHLTLRTLIAMANVQFAAGDPDGAARTWAQIDAFVASNPNLPTFTLLAFHAAKLAWLRDTGADFANAKQRATAWLADSKLTAFQGRDLTAVSSAKAATTKRKPASDSGEGIDIQPLEQCTEIRSGELARGRFSLANLGATKTSRVLSLEAPGFAAKWVPLDGGWRIELTAGNGPSETSKKLELGPEEEILLYMETSAADATPHKAKLSVDDRSATWTFVSGPDSRPVAVVSACSVNDNPFYQVSFAHEIYFRASGSRRINLRVNTSEPCRVEIIDASTDSLLAIDASGAGDFRNAGDLVNADADGNRFPDIEVSDKVDVAALELRVYPLLKKDPRTVEIKLFLDAGNGWEEQAVDTLNIR